jgi:regulator of nonsense transcripts 2
MTQVSKNRIDLLPHYSRLIATLNKYMPDIGTEIVAFVSDSESEVEISVSDPYV